MTAPDPDLTGTGDAVSREPATEAGKTLAKWGDWHRNGGHPVLLSDAGFDSVTAAVLAIEAEAAAQAEAKYVAEIDYLRERNHEAAAQAGIDVLREAVRLIAADIGRTRIAGEATIANWKAELDRALDAAPEEPG